jgi:tetratricopeptide (TPR) repeat protein
VGLGDTAMDSQNHDAAIKWYSEALTFDPTHQCDILLKRSTVRAVVGSWEEALIDADKVWIVFHVKRASMIHTIQAVELDPSSHNGYKRKHAALHGMGRHSEAFEAFKTMILKLEESPDPHIRGEPLYQYCVTQHMLTYINHRTSSSVR